MNHAHGGTIHYPIETPPDFGELREVAEGIFWLRLPLPMALDHVNTYVLDDGDSWTIIDTGFDSKKSREIWRSVLNGPLRGKPVGRVLVTHHHPDHIGLAGWFQSEYGAELVTTRTAWLMGRMLTLDEQPVPPKETLEFWRSAGLDADKLAKWSAGRPFNFSDIVTPMPLGFQRIQEDDQISAGGRNWTIRIGHGHAPEHATLWCNDEPLIIAGDQLLPSISPNLGVYPTEPNADPVQEWLQSCEKFLPISTAGHFVLPGHKLPYYGLPVRLRQLIDNHHGALERLLDRLSSPLTAVDCFDVLFKRKIGDAEYGLALVEAVAHVNHLSRRGLVDRKRRDDGAWLWQAKGE